MLIQKKTLAIFALTAILIIPAMHTSAFAISQSSTFLVSSSNPSTVGQPVTFTATVKSADPTVIQPPTGSVMFSDNGVPIGTAPIDPVSLTATLTMSTLTAGSHQINAQYSGDPTFSPSTGILGQTVNSGNSISTTTTLTSDINPSITGQKVTLTAKVTGAGMPPPTGMVSFFDVFGGNPPVLLGSAPLDPNGNAIFPIFTLTAGSHQINAQYSGDGTYSASTSPILTQTVNGGNTISTTTILVSSSNPSTVGQQVTFTAKIGGSIGMPPLSGSVTFFDNGVQIGTKPIDPVSFTSTLTIFTLTAGSHQINAQYSGDSTYSASTSPILTQTVNGGNLVQTTTTLTSDVNPSTLGKIVTLTAKVSGAGSTFVPTGKVSFFDVFTNTMIGSASLDANGIAIFPISTLIAGSHQINAQYSGDGTYSASISTILTQTVNGGNTISTTTILVSSSNPSTVGQQVTFTAKIGGSIGMPPPSGSVSFIDLDTTLVIGSAPLDPISSTATFPISTLTAGSHKINAQYSGDGTYSASTSDILTQTVNGGTSGGTQTTGSVTVVGTCGLLFTSGAPISYGALTPGSTSDEQTLVLHNTGSVPDSVIVQGGIWADSTNTNQMNIGNTKFSTVINTPYSGKTPLSTNGQLLGTVTPTLDVPTYWQLQINLLKPTFAGQLTQTMTFTATC